MKRFYAGEFYKDENGTVYTGEYIEHNNHIKERHTLTWDYVGTEFIF